jgi:hypothetical protein
MKQRLAIIGLGATALLSWGQEPEPRLETEFVASDVYRSGSVIAGLWKDVHFDGEYIGTETANAGLTVLSWQFRWRSLFISPGFGAGFGSGVDVAPIVTLRWKLETPRFFSQGYAAQSLRGHIDEGDHRIYASVLDNNHISVRIGRAELGGLWEHIKYREENDWKGGLRGGWRLGHGFKLIVQSVWPDWEFRGGVSYER